MGLWLTSSPKIREISTDGWLLEGELSSITAHVSGDWVSKVSSVELVFNPTPDIPLSERYKITAKLGRRRNITQI